MYKGTKKGIIPVASKQSQLSTNLFFHPGESCHCHISGFQQGPANIIKVKFKSVNMTNETCIANLRKTIHFKSVDSKI